jgi:DeoR/GlpR family transcriptional regulator of sugar metabolism
MLIDERHNQILEIIKDKTFVSVPKLASQVYASEATIRRDLADLEALGLIRRVRGGASSVETSTGEISSFARQQTNIAEKKRMATSCQSLLANDRSYFFDSSSTVGHLIPFLKKYSGVTVFTNGLENALLLSAVPNVKSYLVGGQIQPQTSTIIGGEAVDYLADLHCDAFFFSCRGFSLKGPSEGTLEQQKIKATMLQHSKTHILIVDSTKFGNDMLVQTCSLQEINVIVTDKKVGEEYLSAFGSFGIKLIVAAI